MLKRTYVTLTHSDMLRKAPLEVEEGCVPLNRSGPCGGRFNYSNFNVGYIQEKMNDLTERSVGIGNLSVL